MIAEQAPTLAARLLREPTFHFVLLAAALFVASAAMGPRGNVIEIDRAEIEARIREFETNRGAPLTAAERREVEEGYIDERVLVLEARAIGLEEDAQIDDFLVQKMLHVLSADVIQPSDAELANYYEQNRARYAAVPAMTVDELVIPTQGPLPQALQAQLGAGTPPERLATSLEIRRNVLADVTLDDLVRVFGEAMAQRVAAAPVGEWVGPHPTVRGQHWLRVTGRTGADVAPLDVVREQVRLDWIGEREAERLQRRVEELRERYRIVFTGEESAR